MYKALILTVAALAAMPAQAQRAPDNEGAAIVVTGRSLSDTEKALLACIARHCPPDQDVDATIAHAENQFVAGAYKGARRTLLSGSRRNKRFAKQYPVAVSDLLRANARVAAHLGEDRAYSGATMDMLSALKAGLADEDPRVLAGRIELADSMFRIGRVYYAADSYREIARDARRLKQPRIEGYALLRLASLYTQIALAPPRSDDGVARKALDALIHSPVPEHRPFAQAARMLRARLTVKRGDDSALDAVIAELRTARSEVPVMVYGEPVKMADQSVREKAAGSVTQRMQMNDVDDQWADIGFWIAPDGRPTDIEVLRASKSNDSWWLSPVLASIRTRRYLPLKREPGDPGILRVERYSLTAPWTTTTGTRLRVRSAQPRIEMLDLSNDEPVPAKAETK